MPSFHSLNTYGFGDSRNHNTKNNQNNQNNAMSKDTKTDKDGFTLCVKPSLRKQQQRAITALTTYVSGFNADPVNTWNMLPEDVRNTPKTLMMALMATQSFAFDNANHACRVHDVNALVNRTRIINDASKTIINPNHADSPSVLEWIGRNSDYLNTHWRYGCSDWGQLMLKDYLTTDSGKVNQSWATSDTATRNRMNEYCRLNGSNLHYMLTWLRRIKNLRSERASTYAGINVSARDRLMQAWQQIHATRAINWSSSLNSFQLRMAERKRPQGACLGIELEFVARSGSSLALWDTDDYPQLPWHVFKGDGSINSNDSSEAVASYQEYACFINGESKNDWDEVRSILNTLTSNGALVNNTCGNHVHLDMRHKSQASYYRTAGRVRDAITTWAHRCVSYKRSHNRYCGIHNGHQGNRYTAVNTACWNEHRTLEVRLGMPTLNPNKLKYWTQFMQYLARDRASIDSLDDFMNGDAPYDLKCYVIRRIKKFESTYVANAQQPLPDFERYVQALAAVADTDNDFTNNPNNV